MSSLRGLIRKEALHIVRDRRTLTVLLLLPVVQVAIFGYAIRTDVDDIRLVIVDQRPDVTTRRLADRFRATETFQLLGVHQHTAELERLFRSGRAQAALVIEPGFEEQLGRRLAARLLLIVDVTEPNTGVLIQNHVERVVRQFERDARASAGGIHIAAETRLRFNPTAESKNLFVPGLMAFILTIISSLMTAITIAREKETGTMETLLVSPLRPWQIILGKVLPYLALGFISVLSVLLEARLLFGVPLRGSLLLLLLEGALYILVSLALGLLISARTSSQRVAMTGALVGTMLPTMILSGFIFPVESMPRVLQLVGKAVPATWFVIIVRGIMLKGIGLEHLWQETLVLAAMALFLLRLSVRSFSARLG